MSHLSTAKLADEMGYSKRQIQRMAANGEVPGASRTPAGHWAIPDTPELRRWMEEYRKTESAQRIVDLCDKAQLQDAFGLVKEILERAHSLRCLLRKAGWAPNSPIWGFLYQELHPLRMTLETLKMPIEEALRYVEEEEERIEAERWGKAPSEEGKNQGSG